MTAGDYLAQQIGELSVKLAVVLEERDRLREQMLALARRDHPAPPEAVPEPVKVGGS